MPVVAITGSSGKTSTKDLLAAALPGAWASPRSFNNEVGVPLTVLQTPNDCRYLVVEVAAARYASVATGSNQVVPMSFAASSTGRPVTCDGACGTATWSHTAT